MRRYRLALWTVCTFLFKQHSVYNSECIQSLCIHSIPQQKYKLSFTTRDLMSRKSLALIATTLLAVITAGNALADRGSSFSSYARVTHVEPIYKSYTVQEPQQHCQYIRNHGQQRVNRNHNQRRQFVSGNYYGQNGNDRRRNQRVDNQSKRNFGNRGRQHCVTKTISRQVRRQDGFRVTYVYQGNKFQTRTDYHPGHQIRISVQIQPH